VFRADPARIPEALRALMRLDVLERQAVSQAAEVWAATATSRKKVRSAASSAGPTRRVRDCNPRQVGESARRHLAVSRTAPA
jgi:hypothetical protein